MKIGFPADSNHLDARIQDRMSAAVWLTVVDTDNMRVESRPAPPSSGGAGAGVRAVAGLVDMGAAVLMTGFISPVIAQSLENSGIRVLTDVSGTVRQAVTAYRDNGPARRPAYTPATASAALHQTVTQFRNMIPVLIGVILLMGLIQIFLSKELVITLFSGHPLLDTLTGTVMGGIFTGNPVNGYVIGRSLLEWGARWPGVCALMMAWVSVGLAQMPAEIHALGLRFALVRNGAAFIMTILFSILTVFFSGMRP